MTEEDKKDSGDASTSSGSSSTSGQRLGGLDALVGASVPDPASDQEAPKHEAPRDSVPVPSEAPEAKTSEPPPPKPAPAPAAAPSTPGLGNISSLADLAQATPVEQEDEPEDEPETGSAAPPSPFAAPQQSSKYTFVMNSADLKDLIGDPNQKQVTTHSSASAGFQSAPKVADSIATGDLPRPGTGDLPGSATGDLQSRGPRPARPQSRGPSVVGGPEPERFWGGTLLIVALLLGVLILVLSRDDTPVRSQVETGVSAPAAGSGGTE